MNKVELLRQVIEMFEDGTTSNAATIKEMLVNEGITFNMHVGMPPEFFENNNDHLVEWILGQYIAIIEHEAWNALGSFIPQTYSWLKQVELTDNE
jgi:hypothetical protein